MILLLFPLFLVLLWETALALLLIISVGSLPLFYTECFPIDLAKELGEQAKWDP